MSIKIDLSGKTALVTGASGGLGRHFAHTLAKAGAQVAIAARRADKIANVVSEIKLSGGRAIALTMDVVDRDSVAGAFEAAYQQLGPVTIIVNNAGISGRGSALKLDEEIFDDVMSTNLKGVWNVAQEAGQRMVSGGQHGSIVNIASILGLRIAKGLLPYAVSKAGVVQMTKVLALEWAQHSIRVNALAPGYFITDLNRDFLESEHGQEIIGRIPQRRTGNIHDLDGPLLLLASDAGAYMTGVIMPVDGGHLISSV
ncbi:MAG: 2-deoxy-D-gluconate 3-dehydrogenase [Rhodospirillaceae bacterium TMED8]|nr:2-deoxy-D-gluconate 3-dehydrogenase [Magnetovibrio sp.]OUT49020.1 MAG: 2-deoxy-D-gluconate 3-dehydrogenase [Rhodospirillaceae bacterium TMED8]|tara:strand:- start:218 stop:985 length:768 start_codon:yes stop_codon:yes gene_type:complete